jgi:hypothetical protein
MGLTNRSSQPLAAAMSSFTFMRTLLTVAKLGFASGD